MKIYKSLLKSIALFAAFSNIDCKAYGINDTVEVRYAISDFASRAISLALGFNVSVGSGFNIMHISKHFTGSEEITARNNESQAEEQFDTDRYLEERQTLKDRITKSQLSHNKKLDKACIKFLFILNSIIANSSAITVSNKNEDEIFLTLDTEQFSCSGCQFSDMRIVLKKTNNNFYTILTAFPIDKYRKNKKNGNLNFVINDEYLRQITESARITLEEHNADQLIEIYHNRFASLNGEQDSTDYTDYEHEQTTSSDDEVDQVNEQPESNQELDMNQFLAEHQDDPFCECLYYFALLQSTSDSIYRKRIISEAMQKFSNDCDMLYYFFDEGLANKIIKRKDFVGLRVDIEIMDTIYKRLALLFAEELKDLIFREKSSNNDIILKAKRIDSLFGSRIYASAKHALHRHILLGGSIIFSNSDFSMACAKKLVRICNQSRSNALIDSLTIFFIKITEENAGDYCNNLNRHDREHHAAHFLNLNRYTQEQLITHFLKERYVFLQIFDYLRQNNMINLKSIEDESPILLTLSKYLINHGPLPQECVIEENSIIPIISNRNKNYEARAKFKSLLSLKTDELPKRHNISIVLDGGANALNTLVHSLGGTNLQEKSDEYMLLLKLLSYPDGRSLFLIKLNKISKDAFGMLNDIICNFFSTTNSYNKNNNKDLIDKIYKDIERVSGLGIKLYPSSDDTDRKFMTRLKNSKQSIYKKLQISPLQKCT